MVIKNKPVPMVVDPIGTKKVGHARCPFAVDGCWGESERVPPERPRRQPAPPSPPKGRGRAPRAPSERFTDVLVVRPTTAPAFSSKPNRSSRVSPSPAVPEPEDVIDLGAPRTRAAPLPPRRAAYVPNPRLYPGPERSRRPVDSRAGGEGRVRRRKRAPRRAVPNARLYTPAPPAPRRAPPPPRPRAAWPPPAPAARLDSASRAALQLSEQRRVPGPLVVTLPPGASAPPRYHPTSAHFRLRSLDAGSGESSPAAARVLRPAAPPTMSGHSVAPEDYSDGNETLSAPSEFLAEFLSAIMRRQYAEALKYCRLILQYEPHNATARGFYPLLQQKVRAQRPDAGCPQDTSSEEASIPSAGSPGPTSHGDKYETMEQGGDSSEQSEQSEAEGGAEWRSGDSCRSQSSLELDSSSASPGAAWDSTGSASRSDTDDNGNATSAPPAPSLCAGDLANDNAPAADKGETSVLQRLRAQFACSIK